MKESGPKVRREAGLVHIGVGLFMTVLTVATTVGMCSVVTGQ